MSSKQQGEQSNDAEKNIEIWKVKKLIKRLEAARGNGTSMISLIIRKLACYHEGGMTNTSSAKGSGVARREDVG